MNKERKMIIAGISIALLLMGIYFLFREEPSHKKNPSNLGFKKEKSFFSRFSSDTDAEPTNLPNGDLHLNPELTLKQTRDEYRRRAGYPPYCEPIPVDGGKVVDPIKEETTIFPAKVKNPNNPGGPFLIHYLEKNNYHPGDTVVIHAYITDGQNNKIKTNSLKAHLSASGGMNGKILSSVTMSDNGGKYDTAGDLIYTATFSTSGIPDKPQNYTIILKYDEPKKDLTATNSFNFGSLNINNLGKFSDSSTGKDLIIKQQVKIEKKGIYHIQGSLYSSSGIPIGRAQARHEFDPGVHTVELKWYGKLFCDAGESGPYKLKYLLLANTTEMPGPRSERLENLHETGPYNVKEFSCESFNDEFFNEKADQMDKELQEKK
ncbi:MAG: hypothetical protein IT569_10300 [Leptospiraceae bacterium]|nr:hypothetical protein [Leptospiraceae bacterium]